MSLLSQMEDNLASHATYLHAAVPGALATCSPQVWIADSGLDHDTFNVVSRGRFSASDADAVAAVVADLRRRARPFSWWVAPTSTPSGLSELLAAAGAPVSETEEAMSASLASVSLDAPAAEGPDRLRIELVRTFAQVEAYARLVAANWDPPATPVARFYGLAAEAILAPGGPSRFVLGYVGDEPVAGAEVHLGAVAGLYGVVTRADHRRRGHGTAVTRHALRLAREAGCETAVLQASSDGAPVYRKLGFATVGRYVEHAIEA